MELPFASCAWVLLHVRVLYEAEMLCHNLHDRLVSYTEKESVCEGEGGRGGVSQFERVCVRV